MSGWKKVRSLFWQQGEAEPDALAGEAADLSDEDFAALLAGNEHAVPSGPAEPVDATSIAVTTAADGAIEIDFQTQYDEAGIPDTDEVEQLESFLTRLDAALPKASKIAAAEAFLGAIGKDKSAVMTDAERKIQRVRGLLAAKEAATGDSIATEQASIDQLLQQIEGHKQRMEDLNRELEGVRRACLVEESRLQAARVFFGSVTPTAKS
ncbi:MAG: hypothetical protein JW751_23950 [Polyangiaceae bacterium]|nr:hypothetical protein [Polyangiaceae bacterium]